jgi:hypothetical protein
VNAEKSTVLALVAAVTLCCSTAVPRATTGTSSTPLVSTQQPTLPIRPEPSSAAVPGTDPCAAIAAQFDAVLKASSGRCASDADCACFSDVRVDNQMGVGDRATSAKLQAYSADYRKRQCPTVCVQTAQPPACKARCQSGVCRSG